MDNLYANVPRDLTRVKSKLFLNLTKRQILCFGAAILVGLPLFFLLKKTGNMTLAAMGMIIIMLPFFFLAMYERNKDGNIRYIRSKIVRATAEQLELVATFISALGVIGADDAECNRPIQKKEQEVVV